MTERILVLSGASQIDGFLLLGERVLRVIDRTQGGHGSDQGNPVIRVTSKQTNQRNSKQSRPDKRE